MKKSKTLVAIDPGPVNSALVVWDGQQLKYTRLARNAEILDLLISPMEWLAWEGPRPDLIIEQVRCYGMAVGQTVFDTVFWSGRFAQAWEWEGGLAEWHQVSRLNVKMHLCHNPRAKDSNIRQALIDRFGPPGTKKSPGLTYGLKKDLWAAFALAVYWHDTSSQPQA